MGDADKIGTRYNYVFIHNVFGNFYKDLLDYFSDYLYPRFEWKIVGTYYKAIEYLQKNSQYGQEVDQPNLPALILNPSGDFGLDETYGKMLWRFPNLYPGFIKRVFAPIYQDSNVVLTIGFSRVKGECEFIAMVPSYYEYLDVKMYLFLIFGGMDRYIYPRYFNSFIILPPEVYNYEYNNPITGVHYKINIPDLTDKLVKTTNRTEKVVPCRIKPIFKLTNISDTSTRLGGVDRLPEWRLSFTVEYEVEMPSFMVIETDYLAENIKYSLRYGSAYSANQDYNSGSMVGVYNIPEAENWEQAYLDSGLVDGTSGVYIEPNKPENCNQSRKEKQISNRYFHVITQADVDATNVVEINLLEQVTDPDLITVTGKYGRMLYGDHYVLSDSGHKITIYKEYVSIKLDDLIEIYTYKLIWQGS